MAFYVYGVYGISEGLLDKLQKAQNAAARLVVIISVIYTGYQSDPE